MEIGSIYDVVIQDLGEGGEGIALCEGVVVFLQGVTWGDRVRLRIQEIKKNYALGTLVERLEASPDRVTPRCAHYDRCGGCQLQELSYPAQLRLKANMIKQAFRRIAGIETAIQPMIGMEDPWHYRNKMIYPIQGSRVGLYARGTHEVVDILQCHLHPVRADEIVETVRRHLKKIPAYDEKRHKGVLRQLMIRCDEGAQKIMAVLVTHEEASLKELTEDLVAFGTEGVIENKNHHRGNRILGRENRCLHGEGELPVQLGGNTFSLSPLSFFQVNSRQAERLYQEIRRMAKGTGTEILFDLYAGMGTIGSCLSRDVKEVYCIEMVPEAVLDGEKSLLQNKIQNVTFLAGDATQKMRQLVGQGVHPDIVVVDPPRKGLEEGLIQSIVAVNPRKILYVSCKASTLARDLKFFFAEGYALSEVQPLDLFPQTTHVETVVLMSRVENKSVENIEIKGFSELLSKNSK